MARWYRDTYPYDPVLDAHLSRVHACDECGAPTVVVGLELRDWRFADLCDDVDRPMHRCKQEPAPAPIQPPVKVEMASLTRRRNYDG
jgi:hypothetical protein